MAVTSLQVVGQPLLVDGAASGRFQVGVVGGDSEPAAGQFSRQFVTVLDRRRVDDARLAGEARLRQQLLQFVQPLLLRRRLGAHLANIRYLISFRSLFFFDFVFVFFFMVGFVLFFFISGDVNSVFGDFCAFTFFSRLSNSN